jgi:hypothetical protein
MLPLPALDDVEGDRLPAELPPVVDGHVHLFPDRVFAAVWRWFDEHGWPIRYKLASPAVLEFLFSRGVSRVVAFAYAHKPEMSRALNGYLAAIAREEPRVTALATALPGEPGSRALLAEAFAAGLAGVKLHCHVQCFAPDADEAREIYEVCAEADKPVVLHAGREPASRGYKCDVHALCSAERVERVLREHPRLSLSVPHLGADELGAYERLLERYDNLWLDTAMACADYLHFPGWERLLHARPDRVYYGTDFPNLPFAWDREIRRFASLGLGDEHLAMLVGGVASRLFGLRAPTTST